MSLNRKRNNRRARCSLNLNDEEWVKVQAVCNRLMQSPAIYVRNLVLGVIEDELEGLGIDS